MYAVIFKARIKKLDNTYSKMAEQMRELAINQYGCTDFTSVTEGENEIAISYWNNLEQITQWKQDTEHKIAQELGRSTWYQSYSVQVVEILRDYTHE